MKVNVLVNSTKLILDEIDPTETIEAIKGIIYERFKDVSAPLPDNPLSYTYLTINHLRLLYKGKQLPKLSTLAEHAFKDEDTVLLYISPNKQEDPQDDKNEMIHSTLGDEKKKVKYTLTIKNDCTMDAEVPDVEMMEELKEEELNKLLERLPYDIPAPEDSDAPVKYDRTKALPSKIHKVITIFPPTTTGTLNAGPSVAPPAGRILPLTVESYSPVSTIYNDKMPIRIKFSQPMVPLDEYEKVQKSFPVPVKINPQVEGVWDWPDPFNAVFTPSDPYPKSTHFFCTVRGDITSAVGGVMRDPVEWNFASAPLAISLRRTSFGGPRIQTLMTFNQAVNDVKVIQSLVVTTDQDEILDIRHLRLEEHAAQIHPEVKILMEKAIEAGKQKEQVLFEIEDDINGIGKNGSVETEIEVCIAPRLLDLEKELKFKFKTVAALSAKPVKLYNIDPNGKKTPFFHLTDRALDVIFNNQLLPSDRECHLNSVFVEPEIPGMKVATYENILSITGEKTPGDYKVTLKTNIVDSFGQNLEEETTLIFPVTAPTTTSLSISVQGFNSYQPYSAKAHHSNFITLDPSLPPVLHFKSSNTATIHVRAYSVAGDFNPKYYNHFAMYATTERQYPDMSELWRSNVIVEPPKDKNNRDMLHKQTITAIDLSKAFGLDDSGVCGRSKHSQLVVVVRADDTPVVPKEGPLIKKYWLTWNDIGVAYAADEDNIYGWSYSLLTGDPLACTMQLINDNDQILPLVENKNDKIGGAFTQVRAKSADTYKCLIAKYGSRYSFVNLANLFTHQDKPKYIWHVLDDRAQYRPFDRVYLKGMIRQIDYSDNKLTRPDGDNMTLTYTVHDSRSKLIINSTKVEMKSSYCFDFDFELPGTINLGSSTVTMQWGKGVTFVHSVDVEEYKRKAFEMVLKTGKSSVRPREPLNLLAYAQAFTGEVLSGTTAKWRVSVTSAHYNPPNLDAYKFSIIADSFDVENHEWDTERNYSGKHNISVAIDDIITPVNLTFNCTIKDATNETLTATESTLIHPTEVYVGTRSEQQLVNFGDPYKLFAVTCTPEGKFTGNCALHMYARGIPFDLLDGESPAADTAVLDRALTPSDAGPIEVIFEPKFRGKHSITLVSTDLNGKISSAHTDFWVYGAQSLAEKEYEEIKKKEKNTVKEVNPARHIKSITSNLKLVLDRTESYEAGSTAELLIVAPFWPASGAVHFHKNSILMKVEKISVTDSMTRLPIQVASEYLPGITIEVVLIGMASRTPVAAVETLSEAVAEPEHKRLKIDHGSKSKVSTLARGEVTLNVSQDHKKLTLQIAPSHPRAGPYLPGEQVSMDVAVVGPDGKPVTNAEVTLVVVDEAVLALTGYTMKDPRSTFFQRGFTTINTDSTHHNLLLTRILEETVLLPSLPNDGCITIMYFSGRVLKFNVKNTITIAKLKSLIQERDGLPLPTQRLLYKGKQLPDAGTLAEHGVLDGATINLVLRLFGGGPADEKEIRSEPVPVIRIRSNMNALAHFGPNLKTGDNGKATGIFTLPDSLTRYRVMVMANTTDQFGTGELQITASLPLMLRQSPPRFLNFGDSCVLPVMVQNELDTESEILVGIRAQNVEVATKGWKLTLPAHGRAAVPFQIKPTGPGTASFQVAASDSKLTTSDAAQFKFPIHTPTTSEMVASTGVLDGDNVMQQPIAHFSGDNVVATCGGLEVSMASTIFQELTDAALYNIQYPHECSEQLSGRIITLVVFKNLLPLLHRSKSDKGEENPVPDAATLEQRIKGLVTTLLDRKDSQGNFGYWTKNGKAYDYVSVYAHLAIGFASQDGYEAPSNYLANASAFLRTIVSKYTREPSKEQKQSTKETVSQRTLRWLRRVSTSTVDDESEDYMDPDHGLACFAMFVWNEITGSVGTRVAEASKMLNRKKLEKMPLEQIAYLLPTVLNNTANLKLKHKAIYDHLNNSVTHTSTAAHLYHTSPFLRSDIREQAMVLNSLITCDPKNSNIVKMVRGLMDLRKNGRWYNTQDNSFALMAMHKYFNAYEKNFANYVADLWVGQGYVGRTEFDGQNSDTQVTQVPMKQLIAEEENSITLAKKGQGRLYYRIAVEYSPKNLFLPSRNCGFKISRVYSAVLDTNDVIEGSDEGGNRMYTIKAGALVRIKVEMVADGMRSYVALVDHLPGGLEPQNNAHAASGTHTGYSYVHRFWDHQNMRDSRAEVFVDSLYPGLYKYTYIVRAITKGRFLVPPAKAEEMYSPDVFGRSDMMVVSVQ